MSLPTIELSSHQAIHLVDCELVTPSPSFEDLGDHSISEDSLCVPMADVELVESNDDQRASPLNAEPPKRAALLSATVIKTSPQDKLGLGLAKTSRGFLIISSIKPGGLLSKSPFQVGDRLVSINNVSCEHMIKSETAKFLQSITGPLTMVVQNETGDSTLVESMIWKPQADSKTGLAVVSNGYSRARVSNIRPNGLFEPSLLSRKDLILSVNNIPCHFLDSKEVADIVMRAKDSVTIVAERKYESAVVVAMAQ